VGIDARGCGVGRSAARAKGAAIILKKYIASLLSRIFGDLHSSARKWTPIGYARANSLRAKKSVFLYFQYIRAEQIRGKRRAQCGIAY
jgi:hypothetical protein